MSTDLHLHHNLPMLRIPPIKMDNDINNNIISPSSVDAAKTTLNHGATSVVSRLQNADQVVNDGAVSPDDDDEESYRTPTSKESRIPTVLTCPPAPKKTKAFASYKRKLLDEFQFVEVNNKEDMDAFFRSTFPKRTCPCT